MKIKRLLRPLCGLAMTMLLTTGCGEVTYPKETLKETIIKLCAEEYKMDVDVNITGKTLAIYLPLADLFSLTLSLSEGAEEKIQDVLLSASRVALSTDAEIEFYCIIAQDIRIPEIQLVVIKYVDDVKRAFYHDISRGEYFKRTIIDMNENPQARKEKAIMDVFAKMEVEEDLQKKILEDFFRSPPASLEGIGYWDGKFYIKDITLEEFLAQQIANRIKMKFAEEDALKKYALRMITGRFTTEGKVKIFLITFNAESLLFVLDRDIKKPMEKEIFSNTLEIAGDVLYGYKFKDFELVDIIEKNTNARVLVSKDDMYMLKRGKLTIDGILGVN